MLDVSLSFMPCLKMSETNKETLNKNTLKKRRQRAHIREDADRLAAYHEDRKRKLESRTKLSEWQKQHHRLLAAHTLKTKLDMREYRKKSQLKQHKLQKGPVSQEDLWQSKKKKLIKKEKNRKANECLEKQLEK